MRVNCVGAIVRDEQGRLLLVRRGRPPGKGLWSVPGGRVEPGESDAEALAREMREETGLTVRVVGLAGTVDRPGPGGVVYEIRDYLAEACGGTLRAGDDAEDARWFTEDDLARLPLSPGLLDALTGWGVIGRPSGSSATG
ncbi:NUDIX hydrolase [Streptosporangium saharense]|uniref:NUDIX hydrolase n=1 Tax=Streptosporangium saharense TaxID=1706840 RepID=UPI00367BE4D3